MDNTQKTSRNAPVIYTEADVISTMKNLGYDCEQIGTLLARLTRRRINLNIPAIENVNNQLYKVTAMLLDIQTDYHLLHSKARKRDIRNVLLLILAFSLVIAIAIVATLKKI